ncbi:group-specific protein [Alkalibacillus salilacus]|uniref:Group-specific protein n=1 Tax=Alkalibacillus salilacus TaxID=284582 RepID=A0ABT9VGA6_9BACI|nr:group-specific protein [Alkalibacillus salilacus]MDQ0159978.1 hypothetical protein [Alkalibacillus salilacus]
MEYIYHIVPKQMVGDELIPLNKIKYKDTELYESYVEKYQDHPQRIKLLERKVPKLNCLWNDVVHFLPIHPYQVYKELNDIGVNASSELRFYKIPITNLENNQNVIYSYRKENYRGPAADMNEKDIEHLNLDEYEELAFVPTDTIEYFKEQHSQGNRFGMFHFIPHILSLGEVNISDVEVIKWSEQP